IASRKHLEVGVLETLVIAIHGAHLPRPRALDHQGTRGGALELSSLIVDQRRLDAEQWQGRRAWLQRARTRQRADQDAPGLGLPPGVDDRTATIADHVVIPLPGFRIDRLTDTAEDAQGAARVLLHELVALTHQGTQGGRSGIEDVDLVLVD